MPSPSSASATDVTQTGALARSGALSLVGSVTSAAMGFALIIVLGRVLGPGGAGIVLQSIAVFSIALAVTRAGLDTAAVWLLPRVLEDEPGTLRTALRWLLGPSLVLGVLGGLGLWGVSTVLAAYEPALTEPLLVMAVVLPFATVLTVALAATRGLGGVRPYVLIGSIAVPTLRPVLVLAGTTVATGTLAATVAWVLPLPAAALVAVLLLARTLRRHERTHPRSPRGEPGHPLGRRVGGYAVPRSISTVLEQSMQWLDVILVGALAGPAAAGVYGAASRLVAAGQIVSTALRIVVAPLYSRSLGRGRPEEVRAVYTTTTTWMVLFSTPVLVLFAAFGGTVLALLGPGFRSGAQALLILSVGLLAVLLAGNVQSILLMSGRSALAAVNKALALALTLTGIVLLVPAWGIEGAAVAWVLGMVLDSLLALWQVRRLVGVRLEAPRVLLALVVSSASVGLPAAIFRTTLGDTATALALSLAGGGVCLGLSAVALRRRLDLDAILHLVRRRRTA